MIIGEFKDIFDNPYTVMLGTVDEGTLPSPIVTIGDHYNTDSEQDGLLYFTDEPVETEQSMDDLFTQISMQSATIKLYAREFVGAEFFADNDKSLTVQICKASLQDILDGKVGEEVMIFDGYVEPGTFDQEFTNPYDEFTVNCIDKLSTLSYHHYKDIEKLEDYNAALPEIGVVTFWDLLQECIGEFKGKIYYDMSKGINKDRCNLVFKDLKMSEKEIIGDDYDSVWTKEELLQEMLKYLNLHIRQIGSNFYIFDWESVMAKNTRWVELYSNELVELPANTITLNADMNASEDTTVSIDDVYNQIQVTCDMESQDTVVESPLDSDSLVSMFSNKQKYMTEYISEGEGQSAIAGFYCMMANASTDYEAAKKVDWYMQSVQAKNWKLYSHSASAYTDTLVETDENGKCINQYKDSERLRNNLCEPAIMSFGSISYSPQSNDVVSKIDMTPYLCISLNGQHTDSSESSSSPGCLTHYPDTADLEALSNEPIMEYLGSNSGGVFSPTDDATTNYIVFSGKLCFMPIQQQTDIYSRLTKVASSGLTTFRSFYWHKTVPSDNNDDGRYYARKWYKTKYYSDDPNLAEISDTGFHPLTSDKANHQLSYDYTYIGNENPEDDDWRGHYNQKDLCNNVDVLECEMIIGNKRLVQIETSSGATLQWVKLGEEPIITYEGNNYTVTSFSLGINPSIGSKLVGDEFEIRTNVDYTYNIDGGGFAVPIKKSDALTGQVIFRILGPVNGVWQTVYRRHPTWFRHTEYYAHKHYILAHSESIIIKDFKVEFQSDNAGINKDYQTDDNDLVYVSQEETKYINKNDDITFKFITQPTTAEAIAAGVKTDTNYNAVINAQTDVPVTKLYNAVTKDEYKAEQYYVNQYYLCYNKPKIILETDIWDDGDNFNYLNIYKYNALNREFFVRSMSRELYNNKIKLTLREIND